MPLGSAVAIAADRLTRPVEGMHRAISHRWFSALGPVAAPIRLAHDAIADTVYASIRVAGTAVGIGLDLGVRLEEEAADGLRAFVTGVLGDDHGPHSRALDIPMEVRGLADERTGRLVVLVHGVTETERIFGGADGLAAAIDTDPTLTAIPIRYHTGLPIADNGARLADLLEDVVADWPVPVHTIALVGRSMGGLVARAACTIATDAGHGWVGAVSDVITIGTPHRGSYVARFAHAAARGLAIVPETRPLADVLDARSPGIGDLRHGYEAELPAGIDHHFVAGVVTADPDHPVGALVGDALVGRRSAVGHGLGPTTTVTVASAPHGRVHRHPDVVAEVMGWLGRSAG
ncbi:MAG: hypothetical protein AB1Z57_04905 [Acidimicrobiia bacterium]